jgi:hypothetical protein
MGKILAVIIHWFKNKQQLSAVKRPKSRKQNMTGKYDLEN